jgi:GT2 family glycosyltransferase
VRTGLITIVAGRDAHLRRQQEGIAAGTALPDVRVVVAMHAAEAQRYRELCGSTAEVVALPGRGSGLPLARARNAGAQRAVTRGAERLVFLDVDCIPSPALLERYVEVATDDAVSCGTVGYLPPDPPQDLGMAALPHPARPAPRDDEVSPGGDHRLFWSLSFAITATAWQRVGGFSEAYTGYGAEDTDFGQRARAAGLDLHWVGGADAYHQHHPVSDPPVEHLDDILRNGRLYRDRWGEWPMRGWLCEMEERGLVVRRGDDYART